MSHAAHGNDNGGYERRDVAYPPIVLTSFVLLAVVLLSFVTMWWLLSFLTQTNIDRQGPVSAVALESRRAEPPEPRLQAHPLRDMHELRATEKSILEGYGWVDRETGVVHIPVARAIELTAERGLPSQAAK